METNLTSISPNSHGDDILVVDDEAPLLAVAQAILQTVGLTPATASEGGDAVKWVQERIDAKLPVSLVILDLTMPGGLSGFETLEAMREICPNLPVIACSGFFAEGARDLCQAIGFTDILAKPYSPDALLRFARGEMTESIQRSDSPLADAPTADPPQGDSPSDWGMVEADVASIESPEKIESSEDLVPASVDASFDAADASDESTEAVDSPAKNRHPLMKGFGGF